MENIRHNFALIFLFALLIKTEKNSSKNKICIHNFPDRHFNLGVHAELGPS